QASNGPATIYKLTYATSTKTQRSLLVNVQRFGTDTTIDVSGNITGGSSLPAMTFTFDGGSSGFPTSNSTWPAWSDAGAWNQAQYYSTIQFADINGDGKADVCGRDIDGIVCYLAAATGFATTAVRGPAWTDVGAWNQAQYYSTIQFADINGDGKADVCARDIAGIVCHVATGSGFAGTAIRGPGWSDAGLWNQPYYYSTIRFPDINGDGKADVCGRDSLGIQCHLSDGTAFPTPVSGGPSMPDTSGWTLPQYYTTIQFVDINGDGKADVCAR